MDTEVLKGLRETEDFLKIPLIAPDVADDPDFELSGEDMRHGVVRRVGELSLTSELETDSLLSREERSHLHFLYNLESYLSSTLNGGTESLLREHQHSVFEDIYDFLATPPASESGDVQRRGYIELPTGSGKTAIFSTLVNVLNRPLPGSDEKPKALVLVPKLDLVTQTVGVDGQRGFAQFAQDTEVSEYHGKKKDLSGDAVVMSYQSLLGAVERGEISEADFDLIICDEAHRALGEKTRAAIERVANGNLMLGLTASPEFKNRHVKDLFPEQIHSMELREAIEMNLLSPVRCFAVASDAEIETLKSGEFSEKELALLIENEWRNKKAVEFAKAFVADGKSGIISCVPGENTKHASDMAEAISLEYVEDGLTGELRRIRAIAVSGTSENRQAIYEAFERGEIDVLTYVDVLTEGWDSTRAKFLINLRPTTSPVNAIQRLGRVLRKSEDPDDIATVVEFIDKTDKQLFTFFHALGEETIEQGKRIGGGNNVGGNLEGPEGGDSDGDIKELELPKELLDKIAEIDHVTLRELIVSKIDLPVATDDITSINQLTKTYSIGYRTVESIIEELGIEPGTYSYHNRPGIGLTEEQVERITNHPRFISGVEGLSKEDDILSINQLAGQLATSRQTIQKVIKELGIEPGMHRFGQKTGIGLNSEQVEAIMKHPKIASLSQERAPEGVLSVRQFVSANNTSMPMVNRLLEELGIEPSAYRFGVKTAPGLTEEDQARVLAHPHFNAQEATDDILSINGAAKELGIGNAKVAALVEELGIELGNYKIGTKIVPAMTPDQFEILKSHPSVNILPMMTDGIASISAFADQIGIHPKTLKRLIDDLGIELDDYRVKNGNAAKGLTSKQQETVRLEVKKRYNK